MKRYQLLSRIQTLGWASNLALFLLLGLTVAQAQTPSKAAGEISVARQATVNGVAARSSGATIFSNSRILTGERGSVAISLGRRGRVELGAKTDLTLQFASGFVGGDLHAGRLVLSVPAGVALSLSTGQGLVKSDGLQPTVVTVETEKDIIKVLSHLGEAKLTAGGQTEVITPGEEVAFNSNSRAAGWQRRRLLAASLVGAGGVAGITSASQVASQAVQPAAALSSKPPVTLGSLLNSGINYSISRIFGAPGDPERFFDTTLVCRDTENFLCRRRSSPNP